MDTGSQLDPKRTCLLFFDTSDLFVNGPTLDPTERTEQAARAVANWQLQLARARELDMAVAYALTGHRPDGLTSFPRLTDKDSGGTIYPEGSRRQSPSRSVVNSREMAIVPEIAATPRDYVIWKPRWDPFRHTGLEQALRVRGVDTVVLNGGSIEVGVASTAYAIQALDFDLVVVSDGCTSRRADCYDVFMNHVFPRIGCVRTTEQVLEMLA